MTKGHAERAHALLSASKAYQWINNPPSARLQEGIPDVQTEDSKRGTLAHELAENKLRRLILNPDSGRLQELDSKLTEIQANPLYDREMEETISEYARIVEEHFMEAKARSSDAVALFEEELEFSEWVPEGYGTCDVVLVADGVLEVIDLKYGKGVPVSAEDNPQIQLYALGAWSSYNILYLINEVRMTIIQPRLDSISTATKGIEELLEWAETVVKPAAQLAWEGKGECHYGPWCRWCKVKALCRSRAEENMKALQYEFRDPRLLKDEEISSILTIADELSTWAKDVQKYAFERAVAGHKIPQWKLVEGRSNRVIINKVAAQTALETAGLQEDKFLKPRELLGIGDLEKKVGKKELAALIGSLIVKPDGKPTLVPETDKRSELNSVENDFADIDMEA
jgi:hypothetical protein